MTALQCRIAMDFSKLPQMLVLHSSTIAAVGYDAESATLYICFANSRTTYAYQGGGHGVPAERIAALEQWIHGDCQPDLTLLFDVAPGVSRERLARSAREGRELDKFEREREAFFVRVREAYLARAAAEPRRFRVVESSRGVDDVRAELARILDGFA